MTAEKFAEYIIKEYENSSGQTLSDIARAADRDYLVSGISQADLQSPVTRKFAAVILHRAMQRLRHEEDEDWGIAKGFRDIYDCRVCANAIAQVSVKGIIPPNTDTLFGTQGILSEEEIPAIVGRLWDVSQRITKLLDS